jgi:phosphatidylserine synthase
MTEAASRWNAPNALSAMRIVLAPVLLALAVHHQHSWFLACLVVTLLSDIADGKLARWLGVCSDFGARLDSWGDLATYSIVPVCALWLRPEIIRSEAPFFWAVVAGYALPVAFGFAKFRALTSYHTRNAVIAAYLLGGAAVVLFAGGSTWPFRIAAAFLVLAESEEIAISWVLPRACLNVRSLAAARRLAEDLGRAGAAAPASGSQESGR